MFQQIFAVMNELVDEIMLRYPQSSSQQRGEMLEQLAQLRQISDVFIEEWLCLEEKLADFRDQYPQEAAAAGITVLSELSDQSPPFPAQSSAFGVQIAASSRLYSGDGSADDIQPLAAKSGTTMQQQSSFALDVSGETVERIAIGQGYFKLFMFPEAARHFRLAVDKAPECDLARMYLAMSLMHLQQWTDAELHFKLLVSLTDYPRWKAIGFNALGCIQAVRLNIDNAERLFRQAHKIDPGFEDPLTNLKSCRQAPGSLSLYFGSAELTCL